jgi:hypothetical protein
MDTFEFLDGEETQQYQLLIVLPRRGHMDRARYVYGYLSILMKEAIIQVCMNEPDYSAALLPNQEFN